MAGPSVTYTFTNGTAADAGQVNTNFQDLINGATDGTKDYSINALTIAGTLTANGNVNLGNASGDDITITGSLASTIAVKTDSTFSIGSTSLRLARVWTDAISGTPTNDSAAAGDVGEIMSSTPGTTNAAGNGVFVDAGSLSLTAGDWDLSFLATMDNNSGSVNSYTIGISTATGNDQTGLTAGVNRLDNVYPAAAGYTAAMSLPSYRVSISSTTTYYGKLGFAYTSGTPRAAGSRLSARRIR